MKNKKIIFSLVILALLIKVGVFLFSSIHAPESKIYPDSPRYIVTSQFLAEEGVFAREKRGNGNYIYEDFRTPGYPFFLAVFHRWLKIPLTGIVFIQLLLSVLAAFVTSKAAGLIDKRLGVLSGLIVLFDPNITIYSSMIVTEPLFLLLVSCLMYVFIRFIREERWQDIIAAAVILAIATYVRPIGYYLGAVLALFVMGLSIARKNKKVFVQSVIFFIIVYSVIGIWLWRNNLRFKQVQMSNITQLVTPEEGLFHSYGRNKDPISKGLPPVAYYPNVFSRCLLSLMTRPASFKYFNFYPLTVAGKVFSYPWIVFWITGLPLGLAKMKDKASVCFLFLSIAYFAGAAVCGGMWGIGARFRIPIMPYAAILSSYGWLWLTRLRKSD